MHHASRDGLSVGVTYYQGGRGHWTVYLTVIYKNSQVIECTMHEGIGCLLGVIYIQGERGQWIVNLFVIILKQSRHRMHHA